LAAPAPKSFLRLLGKQFRETLVILLLGAAVVSFLLALADGKRSALIEPVVILMILVLNAVVGILQENGAEEAIAKLKGMEASEATVRRAGVLRLVPCVDVVPGDVVVVAPGDRVPADLRIVKILSSVFSVDESALTGESLPVSKTVDVISFSNELVDQDKLNMAFSSSLVVRGKAEGVVVSIGMETSLGKISASLQRSDGEENKTPLQEKLDEFGEMLSKVIGVICIIVWLINFKNFSSPEFGGLVGGAVYYFKIAVALAVAAIPEGLPAVVTTCLALGTMKMAKKNAIVRSLPSVETLGCTSVICSDKTGTLTTNQMTVTRFFVLNAKPSLELVDFRVSGNGWSPLGKIEDSRGNTIKTPADNPAVLKLSKTCTLCNEASIFQSERGVYDKTGESTEAALKVLCEKIGFPSEETHSSLSAENVANRCSNHWNRDFKKLQVLEFSRDRKSMSVFGVDLTSKAKVLYVKGAPESILPRCVSVCDSNGAVVPLTGELRSIVSKKLESYASESLRCIAFAYSENIVLDDKDPRLLDSKNYSSIESGLTFIGVAAMLDPPRPGLEAALRTCSQAGIRVVMITGDHISTAVSIGRKIGLIDFDGDETCAVLGSEFVVMNEREQMECVHSCRIFARVEPTHKLEIVKRLQQQSEIVAMTGDGVNDAPALNKADIGIAMGTGTAVAKEASDMVLADDNFCTIVHAVEHGRAIYANTKQFIRYLISSNIGEVACIFLTAALGIPDVLIPVQLLWVNLVTDGLPATALGFNPPDIGLMNQPPRQKNEPIVSGWLLFRFIVIGLYVGIATILGFIWWYLWDDTGPMLSFEQLSNYLSCSPEKELFQGLNCNLFESRLPSTMALSVLVTIEMLNALNALSENQRYAVS
jgi:calcium-translocating P-type ATPase